MAVSPRRTIPIDTISATNGDAVLAEGFCSFVS